MATELQLSLIAAAAVKRDQRCVLLGQAQSDDLDNNLLTYGLQDPGGRSCTSSESLVKLCRYGIHNNHGLFKKGTQQRRPKEA